MDNRKIVTENLVMAERCVREGIKHIARQQQWVRELERDDLAATAIQANALLRQFEDSFALHVADRDRLFAELKQIDEA